jgi:hydroxypyruvate isomerase
MDVQDFLQSLLSSPEFTTLLLTTFATVVTAIVGAVAIQFRKRILHELSATDLAMLRQIATLAVQYVEQKFKEAEGQTKLAEAIRVANTMIASYGINVTVEQLAAIVEAAVYAETVHEPVGPAAVGFPSPLGIE